jgi:hypothetical protein
MMNKIAKIAIVVAANLGGFAWVIGVIIGIGFVSPILKPIWEAYPLMIVAAVWATAVLGALSAACFIEDGVSVGAFIACLTIGGPLVILGAGLSLFGGPLMAAFALSEKWFPEKEKKETPATHWSKRIVFRCPYHAKQT